MIRHVALFIIKDQFNGVNKAELIKQIQRNVCTMREQIKTIKSIEACTNYEDASAVFPATDLCVLADFESLDDYHYYFHHAVHQKAASFAAGVSNYVTAISYQVEC